MVFSISAFSSSFSPSIFARVETDPKDDDQEASPTDPRANQVMPAGGRYAFVRICR